MKVICSFLFLATALTASAGVEIDSKAFIKSLGTVKKGKIDTVDYELSGSGYRTYKPEISPTPEGGVFASVRIDYRRGWMSSDDHAVLEITISPLGVISSAKSNIAIQGMSISSDVILGTNEAGKVVSNAERAVQVGADLVSDLSAKLLRSNVVEAGRVTFPAAIKHNYNQIYQAIRVDGSPVPSLAPVVPPTAPKPAPAAPPANPAAPAALPNPAAPAALPNPAAPAAPSTPAEPAPPVAKPVPGNAPLDVQPFNGQPAADLPAGQ